MATASARTRKPPLAARFGPAGARIAVASVLCAIVRDAPAFTQCPPGSQPCATPGQVLGYLILPTLAVVVAARFAGRLQRPWLRRGLLILLPIVSALWLLAILFAFNAFLAPCTNTCWYGG